MWNIAVCDDDKSVCKQLQSLLYQYDISLKISLFHSGSELLNNGECYDVIFLDIEMPDINGIQTANELRKRNKSLYVIFLTNHPDYVQEAFKVRAYRYFNKPINQKLLSEVMNEVEREALEETKITLTNEGRTHIVNVSDITHIEAYGDGTYVYTLNGVYETRQPLKYWLSELHGKHFIKVHQAFIVSLDMIINTDKTELIMRGGRKIPVSRRNQHSTRKEIYAYIESTAKRIRVE